MKKSLLSLFEGKPTKFFNEVRENLDRKAVQSVETIMEAVAPSVFEEEVEHVDEDMGVHTIATKHGGKNGKQFATLVVNKKRRSKADAQKKWTDLIKKNQPKETVWDKHTKLDS